MQIKYDDIIQDTVREMSLNVSTMSSDKRDQSVSSGLLCVDLILGNGGWIPGWHTSAGHEQSSKCLRGNTLVNTSNGWQTLKELVGKNKGFRKTDLNTISYDGRVFDKKLRISHTFSEKVSRLVRLKTHNGFELEGTPEHPILVFNENLDFEWKKLENIEIDDWVVSDNGNEKLYGNSSITKSQASVLGYLTANGKNGFFSSYDVEVIDRFKAAVKEGWKSNTLRIVDCYREDRICGVKLVNENWEKNGGFYKESIVKKFGYTGHKAKFKNVAESVRTAGKDVIREFLESYFECDSGIFNNRISIISASRTLMDQIQILLIDFGIYSRKSSFLSSARNSSNPKLRTYYKLVLTGENNRVFLNTFPRAKVNKYKDRILDNLSSTQGKNSIYDVIPYVRNVCSQAYEKAKVDKNKYNSDVFDTDGNIIRNFAKIDFIRTSTSGTGKNHWTSKYIFDRVDWGFYLNHIARIDPQLSSKLKMLVNSSIRFEKVVKLEKKKKNRTVYDITVPKGESFWANGIMSHNTTLAMLGLHQAFKRDIPVKQIWDYEHTFDPEYMLNFHDTSLPQNFLGERNKEGKWIKKPDIWYNEENIAEKFFEGTASLLKKLPNKIKYGNDWYYTFPKNTKNKSLVGDNIDTTLSKMTGLLCVPAEDGRPQGFMLLDSYPMMNPRSQDEKGMADGRMGGAAPSMFSRNIPTVKGLLAEKKIILVGINQFRKDPGAGQFRNPDYETGGNALKTNSDVRLKHQARAIPPSYKNWGKKAQAQHLLEKSVHGGEDVYRFISISIEKNKVGGSPRGTEIFQRIWVGDNRGIARGMDPVFDTYQYLILTNQATGNLKKIRVHMKTKNHLNGTTLDFLQLKTLILGNPDQKKKVATRLKLKGNPKIRDACFKQIRSGKAYEWF